MSLAILQEAPGNRALVVREERGSAVERGEMMIDLGLRGVVIPRGAVIPRKGQDAKIGER